MAEGYHEAYRRRIERQRVIYPDEWRFADDATYSSPYFSGGQDAPIGKFMKAPDMTMSNGATMEARVYAAKLPDWQPVEFTSWPSDNGFAMRTRFEGHTEDGRKFGFYALDFVQTNEERLITRWETFVDGEEFGPLVEMAVGVRGPFDSFSSYWTALDRRLRELDTT